jgi:hypothetical protein
VFAGEINGLVVVQNRFLRAELVLPLGVRFLSWIERRSQRSAEIIILPSISLRPTGLARAIPGTQIGLTPLYLRPYWHCGNLRRSA